MTKLKIETELVRVSVKPEERVDGAICNAVNFAKKYQCNVILEANGVSKIITPESDPDKVYQNHFI